MVPNTSDTRGPQRLIQEAPTDISSDTTEFAGDFEKRAPPKETGRLQQIQQSLGKKKLQAGKKYAIQVTWTKNAPGSSTGFDTPAKAEIKKTQEQYGFDHIAIIVGKVEKDENHELDFKGNWYYLTSKTQGTGNKKWYTTSPKVGDVWQKSNTDKTIKFSNLKEIGGNWEEKVKHAAKAAAQVSTSNGNKWQGGKNDCKTYVEAFEKALK